MKGGVNKEADENPGAYIYKKINKHFDPSTIRGITRNIKDYVGPLYEICIQSHPLISFTILRSDIKNYITTILCSGNDIVPNNDDEEHFPFAQILSLEQRIRNNFPIYLELLTDMNFGRCANIDFGQVDTWLNNANNIGYENSFISNTIRHEPIDWFTNSNFIITQGVGTGHNNEFILTRIL